MVANDAFRLDDSRFLAAVLWVVAAGALWLLVSPAAFNRRALQQRVAGMEAEVARAEAHNLALRDRRDGLKGDPSVIEAESRRLGYGRPNERTYPLAEGAGRKVTAADSTTANATHREAASAERSARQGVSRVVMLIVAGAALFLFFRDLRIN